MKILHTSDWHLDAKLEQKSRSAEHDLFLEWLRKTLISEEIDVLIVAGDVFDQGTPGNASYLRYSRFLGDIFRDAEAGKSRCRNVFVTAGNHDSPSFLRTSEPFLEILGMHVVTVPEAEIEKMIFPVSDSSGKTRLLVLAVPYLRERDLAAFIDHSVDMDLSRKTLDAFRKFYRQITDRAVEIREKLLRREYPDWEERTRDFSENERQREAARRIPLLATGHLFTAHGKTVEDDGVRPVHVGTLDQFPVEDFPAELDYLALGHLHIPQSIKGKENIRYSGSPIPMGFSEIGTPKQVVILETLEGEENSENSLHVPEKVFPFRIESKTIPVFQTLKVLRGDFQEIEAAARALPAEEPRIWVKAVFAGEYYELSVRDQIEELFQALPHLDLVSFENQTSRTRQKSEEVSQHEDLRQLDENEVFERFLEVCHGMMSQESQEKLKETFRELQDMFEAEQIRKTEMSEEDFSETDSSNGK